MIAALSLHDFFLLSPFWILLAGALLFLLLSLFPRLASEKIILPLSIVLIILAFGFAAYLPPSQNPLLTRWLIFDPMSRLFSLFSLLTALISTAFARGLPKEVPQCEYHFFLFSALLGLLLVSLAGDFLILFLGLEILSISLYLLAAILKTHGTSAEGAVKYFLLGSLAAGILLYGIALLYGSSGTTQFGEFQKAFFTGGENERILFMIGLVFVTIGLAFKAPLVPFHTWAPDVYEGSTLPVVAFMVTGTKIGAFAAFSRLFLILLPTFSPLWDIGAALLLIPSFLVAGLSALRQKSLHRFLGYTGVSHSALLMLAIIGGGAFGLQLLLYYASVYILATFGLFSIACMIEKEGGESPSFADFEGLGNRYPLQGILMVLFLASLAGLPLTAGFIGKFLLISGAYNEGYILVASTALFAALLGAYYYLRIACLLFSKESSQIKVKTSLITQSIGFAAGALLLLLATLPNLFFTVLG